MKIAYCIKCGNKFPEEAVFCPYCGTRIFRPEDAKTNIKPEEVIVDIPSAAIVVEPEPLPDKPVEEVAPIVEESIPIVETTEPEGANQEVAPVDESTPTEEIVSEPEVVEDSKKEETPEVADIQSGPIDEEELEGPKIGVCILAFFFPIVGFIAASSNRGTNKKKAKTYSMWAWIGFGVGFISKMISAAV